MRSRCPWRPTCLLGLVLSACGGGGAAGECTTPAEQCGGATSCYATCFCETGADPTCRGSCNLAADSPLVLDVSSWPADPAEGDLLALINAQRSAGGCCGSGSCFPPAPALTSDDALTLAARRHAADMAARGYFSHDTPEGLTLLDRIRAVGYRKCDVGENLAIAYTTAQDVVDAWLASTDHCENIFWPSFTAVGIARADAQNQGTGPLWVADFGG